MKEGEEKKGVNWRKIYRIVLACFALLLLSTALYFYFNIDRIAQKKLAKIVYEKSDSTYRFTFESIDFKIFERKIQLNNFALYPDPLVEATSSKSFYHLSSNFLCIEAIDYLSIFRELKFKAGKFSIESPKLTLSSGDDVGLNQLSNSKMQVGDTLVLPLISAIQFDTLEIIDARLKIDSMFLEKYELPKVNLEVVNFKLGGVKTTPTPFPFDIDDLSLKVENISDELPDSLHLLSIAQVNLSLMHANVKAKNVKLGMKPGIVNPSENIYSLNIPEIVMYSPNAEKFYMVDTLTVDSLLMIDPSINITFNSITSNVTPPNEINLYKLFEDRWNWVKIGQFSIKNGDVKFFPKNGNAETQHFENIDIIFSDFMIDPLSYKDETRILSAKSLFAKMSKFILYHTDNYHLLTIENIEADTKKQFLTAQSVNFIPRENAQSNKIASKINITSKGLNCKGFNFLEFYHKQIIPMQEMVIKSPVAKVHFDRQSATDKTVRDKSIILEKTHDYLTGIYVGNTLIKDGSVEYNYTNAEDKPGFFKSKFDFELKKLSIDSVTFYQSDKIFFANEFLINFSDIDLQLADNKHQLHTKSVKLSSVNQSAEMIDFSIFPTPNAANSDSIPSTELFNISFPKINFSGANLHKAFFEKQLYIENFSIENPSFSFEKNGDFKTGTAPVEPYQTTIYSLVDEYLFNIQIANLSMDNGTLNLLFKKKNEPDFSFSNAFSVKLTNFELNERSATNKNKLFFSEDIDLVLKKQELKLADGVHKISADEIGILSSKNEVYIKNASLAPNFNAAQFKKMPITVFANIPEMRATEVNILELMNEGIFNVGTVSFNNPEIKLLIQNNNQQQEAEKENKPIILLEDIKNFASKKIKINNGSLQLQQLVDNAANTFSKTKINFEMDNFNINLKNDDYTTTYSNYTLFFSDFDFQLPDNIHTMKAKDMNYQMGNKTLEVFNFEIKPNPDVVQTPNKQYFAISFPELRLAGFNPEELIRNKNLTAKWLFIQNPLAIVNDLQQDNPKPISPYNINLYTTIEAMIKNLKIDEVSLKNATYEKNGENPIKMRNFDLTTQNLKVDENNKNGNKLFFSDKFELKTSPIKGKTKSGYYNYGVNYITLNEKGNFTINGLSLLPVYAQKEYARLRKYQIDHFTLEKIDVKGTGLDIKQFFDTDKIIIDSIQANFDNVRIHRDKTFSINPNAYIKLPQQLIREMDQKICIKKAVLNCPDFLYSELITDEHEPTHLTFANLKVEVDNFTNIKEQTKLNPILKVQANGKVMNTSDANIELDLDLTSPDNNYTFKGSVAPMPLSAFNPITETGMKLTIKEGFSNQMEAYFEANEDSAFGTLSFAYTDLKVSVLTEKKGQVKEDKLVSFLANSMMKSENPKQGKELIPVELKSYRIKQRSIINNSWLTLFNGLKLTLGFKEKEKEKAKHDQTGN
jgi:hypothetical protein